MVSMRHVKKIKPNMAHHVGTNFVFVFVIFQACCFDLGNSKWPFQRQRKNEGFVRQTLCVPSSTKSSSSESTEQMELRILRPSGFDEARYLRVSVPFVLVFQFRLSFMIFLSFSASKINQGRLNLQFNIDSTTKI